MGRIGAHDGDGAKGNAFRPIADAPLVFDPIPDLALGALFSRVAAERGDAIAVIGSDATLSYKALNAASDRLARRLLDAGVTTETVIALALPRSPAMIVALLAIVKAGACYLPLDPHHPVERLGFMIRDSAARLIITRPEIAERFVAAGQTLPECLFPQDDLSGDGLSPLDRATPGPESLAYMMYTSGSTGTPKGAGITHANIVNLAWQPSFSDIGADDTLLQVAAIAFDAATYEIWGALLNGARLLLAPEGPLDLDRLGALIATHRATIMLLTSGVFSEIAHHHLPILAGLKHLMVGGDVMPVAALARVREAYPALRLTNVYGPTETTTIACTYEVPLGAPEAGAVPIGRAIRNVAMLILDAEGEPVAPGVEGELYIAGAGVSRGYLKRPELHAERFLPCPFGPAGALMYRTGDIARQDEDGVIAFLGRADGQVKLRGYRIETGEIEVALTALPHVDQASVQLRTIGQDARLVAYLVVAPGGHTPEAAALRAALARTLPDYMVPQAFILLDRLPLTTNGKIDRRALPDPADMMSRPQAQEPRNEAEALLCRLFTEVLGTPQPGIGDDFFLIGGHSLLAMRLVAALARETGKLFQLGDMFRLRTPEAMAAALDGMDVQDAGPQRGMGWADGRPMLSAGQRRHWLLERLPGLAPAYIIPLAFEMIGPIDADVLEQALADVVRRHVPLRTGIVEQDGLPKGRLIEAAPMLAVQDVSELAGDAQDLAVSDAIAAAADRPFDLAGEPMLRGLLLRLDDQRHLLLLQLHHGAADGESVPPLLADLAVAYRARCGGAAADLPPLPFDHADHAAWHEGWLAQSGEAARQSTYWRTQLAGFAASATIPADLPIDPAAPRRGGRVPFAIAPDAAEALAASAARHGTTSFALVLSAYAALVGHLSGRSDLAIGVAVAGRGRPGLADQVGCLVNVLPIRLDLAAPDRIGEARAALEAMLSHADLPFEQIVAASGVTRQAGRNPVFEAALTWQGHDPAGLLTLPGMMVMPRDIAPRHAKFDLTLEVRPDGAGLFAALDYDASRFSQARAQDWAALLEQAIAALALGDEQAFAPLGFTEIAPAAPHPADAPQVTADPASIALVRGLFVEITGTIDPGLDEDFFLLGGNSLAANRLIAKLKARTGKRMLLEQFLQRPTISGCAATLDALDAAEIASSAVMLQAEGDGLPFFCVHGIDGDLLSLRYLAEAFGTSRPLIGLRALPDDPTGQPIEAMATRYVAALRQHQPHGPYLLGGYSLGGSIAFEMARQLRAAGETIGLLAIIDARWPGWRLSRLNAPRAGLFWLATVPHIVIDELGQLSRERLARKAHNLVKTARRMMRRRRHKTLDDLVDIRLVPSSEQARLQGHLDALATYRPAPCPMPVALFRARAPAALHAWADDAYGWRKTGTGRVSVHVIPGNHISLVREGNARRLAARLNRALDAAEARLRR